MPVCCGGGQKFEEAVPQAVPSSCKLSTTFYRFEAALIRADFRLLQPPSVHPVWDGALITIRLTRGNDRSWTCKH